MENDLIWHSTFRKVNYLYISGAAAESARMKGKTFALWGCWAKYADKLHAIK